MPRGEPKNKLSYKCTSCGWVKWGKHNWVPNHILPNQWYQIKPSGSILDVLKPVFFAIMIGIGTRTQRKTVARTECYPLQWLDYLFVNSVVITCLQTRLQFTDKRRRWSTILIHWGGGDTSRTHCQSSGRVQRVLPNLIGTAGRRAPLNMANSIECKRAKASNKKPQYSSINQVAIIIYWLWSIGTSCRSTSYPLDCCFYSFNSFKFLHYHAKEEEDGIKSKRSSFFLLCFAEGRRQEGVYSGGSAQWSPFSGPQFSLSINNSNY